MNVDSGCEVGSHSDGSLVKDSVDQDAVDQLSLKEEKSVLELHSAKMVLKSLIRENRPTCEPFLNAVDTEGLGLWDYHERVTSPMWLNRIGQNLDENNYKCFAEFAKDFRLIVENCYRYNTTQHPISKKAKRMETIFEGKLSLLSRDIRDKSSIARTSDGRFARASPDENGAFSRTTTREVQSKDLTNSGALVYDYVQSEEMAVAESSRVGSAREKSMQKTLYQEVAISFIKSLEETVEMKQVLECAVVPEIGLFLFLTEQVLRLPETSIYNLEISLVIPNRSVYLNKVMTSLLSSYHERSSMNHRAPMRFKTWEKRLQDRVEKWFEAVQKYNCFLRAANKNMIDVDFFRVVNWKNPFYDDSLKLKSFIDLPIEIRAVLIKALCESCLSSQSVNNHILSLSAEQLRPIPLGYDALGDEYVYFAAFCGEDVRIYKQRQFGEFEFPTLPEPTSPSITASSDDQTNTEVSVEDDGTTPTETPQTENSDKAVDTTVPEKVIVDSDVLPSSQESLCNGNERLSTLSTDNNNVVEETNPDTVSPVPPDESSSLSKTVPVGGYGNESDASTISYHDHMSDSSSQHDPVVTYPSPKKRRRGRPRLKDRSSQEDTNEERLQDDHFVRRSTRKRSKVDYTKMAVSPDKNEEARKKRNLQSSDVSSEQDQLRKPLKKRQYRKRRDRQPPKILEPDVEYGSVDFALVCSSVSDITKLTEEIELQKSDCRKLKATKATLENVSALIERLQWLYSELQGFETRIEKAHFETKVRLKREHDELLHAASVGVPMQTDTKPDSWDSPQSESVSNGGSELATTEFDEETGEVQQEARSRRTRRKPQRYFDNEDEYSGVPSDDELYEPPPGLFEEHRTIFDEDPELRIALLPSAVAELEEILHSRQDLLKKVQKSWVNLSAGEIMPGERRTRHQSKVDSMIFNRAMTQISEGSKHYGPSLLPLISSEDVDIGEVLEKVKAEKAAEKEQRRLERLEEQNKRIAEQKAQRAAQRRANYAKKRLERVQHVKVEDSSQLTMWSPPKKEDFDGMVGGNGIRSNDEAVKKAENVVIRLQSGKMCQALKFQNGRIAPIVKMDNNSKQNVRDLASLYVSGSGKKITITDNSVPTISLNPKKRSLMVPPDVAAARQAAIHAHNNHPSSSNIVDKIKSMRGGSVPRPLMFNSLNIAKKEPKPTVSPSVENNQETTSSLSTVHSKDTRMNIGNMVSVVLPMQNQKQRPAQMQQSSSAAGGSYIIKLPVSTSASLVQNQTIRCLTSVTVQQTNNVISQRKTSIQPFIANQTPVMRTVAPNTVQIPIRIPRTIALNTGSVTTPSVRSPAPFPRSVFSGGIHIQVPTSSLKNSSLLAQSARPTANQNINVQRPNIVTSTKPHGLQVPINLQSQNAIRFVSPTILQRGVRSQSVPESSSSNTFQSISTPTNGVTADTIHVIPSKTHVEQNNTLDSLNSQPSQNSTVTSGIPANKALLLNTEDALAQVMSSEQNASTSLAGSTSFIKSTASNSFSISLASSKPMGIISPIRVSNSALRVGNSAGSVAVFSNASCTSVSTSVNPVSSYVKPTAGVMQQQITVQTQPVAVAHPQTISFTPTAVQGSNTVQLLPQYITTGTLPMVQPLQIIQAPQVSLPVNTPIMLVTPEHQANWRMANQNNDPNTIVNLNSTSVHGHQTNQ